jgi:hypothetical protein
MSDEYRPDGYKPDEYKPDSWDPADEDWEQLFPSTEARGELNPPPRKPPTAVGSAASEPEPRPPRPERGWGIPRRTNVPRAVAQAVDTVLDMLDSIGDTVRSWGIRGI